MSEEGSDRGQQDDGDGSPVRVITEGRRTDVVIDNDDGLNVFTPRMLDALWSGLNGIPEDTRVVVLRSTGRNLFSGGADIKTMVDLSPDDARTFAERGHRIASYLQDELPPVIFVADGYVPGGSLEFACACDLRYCTARSRFALPEITLGILPGWGGTQRLLRIIGPTRAKEVIFTGIPVDSAMALEYGLLNGVEETPEALMARVDEMALTISRMGRTALVEAKRAINRCWSDLIDDGLAAEMEGFSRTFTSPDQKEGMTAFIEKRPARFV